MSGNFDDVVDMMPQKTIDVLKEDKDSIIFGKRLEDKIVDNANNMDLSSLNLLNEKLASQIMSKRTFDTVEDVADAIPQGFSTHFKERILSILENPITKKDMSGFIDKYPSQIRILKYKNDEVLELFKEKVNTENVSQ